MKEYVEPTVILKLASEIVRKSPVRQQSALAHLRALGSAHSRCRMFAVGLGRGQHGVDPGSDC